MKPLDYETTTFPRTKQCPNASSRRRGSLAPIEDKALSSIIRFTSTELAATTNQSKVARDNQENLNRS